LLEDEELLEEEKLGVDGCNAGKAGCCRRGMGEESTRGADKGKGRVVDNLVGEIVEDNGL